MCGIRFVLMHHKDLVRAIKWPIWCIWFVLMRQKEPSAAPTVSWRYPRIQGGTGHVEDVRFDGTFRDYQQRILDESDRYLRQGRLHIVAPPGSGKTILGLNWSAALGRGLGILADRRHRRTVDRPIHHAFHRRRDIPHRSNCGSPLT